MSVLLPTLLPRARLGRSRAVAVAALLAGATGLLAVAFQAKISRKMPDFEVYHRAAVRFNDALPLYVGSDGHFQFKYPPVAAALFAPLGRLGLAPAKVVWFALSVFALLSGLWLSACLVDGGSGRRLRLLVLTFLVEAKFFGHEATLGQVNALLLLLLVLMLQALLDERPIRAGLLLGLITAIKPYGLIFVPYLILKRRFLAALAALAGMTVLAVAPALRYGWRGAWGLYEAWRVSLGRSTPALLTSNDNVSLAGFWAKHLGVESPWLAPAIVLTAGLVLAAMAFASRHGASDRRALLVDVSVLMIVMPLFSPLGWDYVFLWSTPGVMALIATWPGKGLTGRIGIAGTLALIGGTVYDIVGRSLYRQFMASSVLTPVFLLVIGMLLVERRRLGLAAAEPS